MLDCLHQIDNEILLQINGGSTPFWNCFMWTISAKETWLLLYASLLFVFLRNLSLRSTLLMLVTIVLTLVFTDQVCATVIRPLAERMRPSNLDNPISNYVYIVNGYRGGKYGMPSCHSANTFGLAFLIILIVRNRMLSFSMLFWACLNCYSRMHLGVHYLGDLFCGMLVALAGSLLIYHGMKYMINMPSVRSALKITDNDISLVNHRQEFKKCALPVIILVISIVLVAVFAELLNMYI